MQRNDGDRLRQAAISNALVPNSIQQPDIKPLLFLQGKAGHSHLNVTKRPGRINRLGATAYATHTQAVQLKKRLLPYGSN